MGCRRPGRDRRGKIRVRPPGGQDGSGRASGACGPPRRGSRGLFGSRRQCSGSRSSASGGASSVSGVCLIAHQTRYEQPGDGDLQDHRQEEDRPEPSDSPLASGSVPRIATQPSRGRYVPLCQADVRFGKATRGVGRALGRPRTAGHVNRVVDPGQCPLAGVAVEGVDLPVGGAETGAAVEGQKRELAGEAEDVRAGARWRDPPTRSPRRSRRSWRGARASRRSRRGCSGPSR